VIDFGLAKATTGMQLSEQSLFTAFGSITGTPLYMAPEQAKGEVIDPRADLFSFGSVLYAMAAGRPPFRASTALAVLKRVAEDTPRPIRQIIPEVPQWLCDIITKLHAKDPAQRFQTATEVAALLEHHLAHLQQPSLVSRPDSIHLTQPHTSRWPAVTAASLVLLLTVGAALAYAFRPREGPTIIVQQAAATEPQQSVPLGAPTREPMAERPSIVILQGRSAVRDALVDFAEPERRFGDSARDNPLRRAEQCNAFLVRFEMPKAAAESVGRVEKATLSFYVWDPSSAGKTKVCAFPMKTAWEEETVTWREPSTGHSWKGSAGFAIDADAGPPGPGVIVDPEQGNDTADPPIEYQLDVTDLVRAWLNEGAPNHGLAIAAVSDPTVDEGTLTRFQILGSDHKDAQFTPTLTMQMAP
jgi:Protein kinase domain